MQPGTIEVKGIAVTREGERSVPASWRAEASLAGLTVVWFPEENERMGQALLEQLRVRPIGHFPPNATLSWLTPAMKKSLEASNASLVPFDPYMKFDEPVRKRLQEPVSDLLETKRWTLVVVPEAISGKPLARLDREIESFGLQLLSFTAPEHYTAAGFAFGVAGSLASVARAARMAEVISISQYAPMGPLTRVARELHQRGVGDGCSGRPDEVPVWAEGIIGAGETPSCTESLGSEQLIGILDSTYSNPDLGCMERIPNCKILNLSDYRTDATPSCSMEALLTHCPVPGPGSSSPHGTAMAGIVAGSGMQDGGAFPVAACARKGHAFSARLWAVKCQGRLQSFECLTDCHGGAYEKTVSNFFKASYSAGSRLSNNSWGFERLPYDVGAEIVDAFAYDNDNDPDNGVTQKYLWFFAAGNAGGGRSLARPAVAKNDLTAAAVYNGVNGQCFESALYFDPPPCDESKLVSYSSRGPTADGRHGPDLAGASQNVESLRLGTGFSPTNGTSAAVASLTGLGALVRDWLVSRHGVADPNAPLLKALLLNSGEYIPLTPDSSFPSGKIIKIPYPTISIAETLPAPGQGWGRANLSTLCDDWSRARCNRIRSFWKEGDFAAPGQVSHWVVPVRASSAPLKCMLVWMDPPNLAGGGALVNNLDLRVQSPLGTCYRGNRLAGPWSVAGCTVASDSVNVDEGVRVAAPSPGLWKIEVSAAHIGRGPQPWAVTCSGALESSPGDDPAGPAVGAARRSLQQ